MGAPDKPARQSAQHAEGQLHEVGQPGAEPESQLSDALDVLAAALAVGLIVLVDTGHSGAPRALLALGFAFFVPGRAIVTNWRRVAGWAQATLPMILSIAVLTLVATTFLWAHLWNPMTLFQAEAWLSLAGLAVGGARRHRWLPLSARRAAPGAQAGDG